MINALSYIGFRSPSFEEWASFGPEVLGAQLAPHGADGAVRLRVDAAEARITVHPGERDEVAYLGWDVGDQAGLEAVTAAIREAGMQVDDNAGAAGDRHVAALAVFVDEFG